MMAALNVLREEKMRVEDVRRCLFADTDLKATDPAEHHRLLVQTRVELAELTLAITCILQRMGGTDQPPVEPKPRLPVPPRITPPRPPARRDEGLIKRPYQ